MIRSYRGRWPQIAVSAYIDPAAVVIGDVTIGEHSSVWPGVVIRGDVHWIRIGARTNIQDGSILHVMKDQSPLSIGDNVTVGHGVILHGCTVESKVLVGMGSILLNDARIGSGSVIAAGTLVPERTVVPSGTLFMGHPGKVRRSLTPQDLEGIEAYAARYVEYAETYRNEIAPAVVQKRTRDGGGTRISAERGGLSRKLRAFRLASDKSYKELAELMGGGISPETIRTVELGKRVRDRTAFKIERFLVRVDAARSEKRPAQP